MTNLAKFACHKENNTAKYTCQQAEKEKAARRRKTQSKAEREQKIQAHFQSFRFESNLPRFRKSAEI